MDKFRMSVYRFMQGRYGSDALGITVIAASCLLSFLSPFIRLPWLSGASLGLMILAIGRCLSRNIWSRQKENQAFLDFFRPLRRLGRLLKYRFSDRDNRYYQCPHCRQLVRVPRGHGRIEITCPHCQARFVKRS